MLPDAPTLPRPPTLRRRPSSRSVPGRAPLVAPLLLLAGCGIFDPGDGPPAEITDLPRELSVGEIETIEATRAFGLELLRVILEDAPDETHFLSPLSASMALGMTMNGADGETFDAMRATLGFEELPEEEINAAYEALIALLGDLDPHVSFSLANAIWYREDLTPRPPFVARVTEHFDATVDGIDFADPGAADVINGWVREATRERIEEMVSPPIPGNVLAMLLNAIHFEGDWSTQFDPAKTRAEPFRSASGEEIGTVDLMDLKADLRSHFTPSYAAVELPYGGGAFVMDVIVPAGERTVAAVLDELVAGGWEELVAALEAEPAEVQVFLPRFELEWERTLNDDLAAMGMGVAFGPGADLTRMFEGSSPYIDEVRQKTFVRVDEEGTEAAAATVVVVVESLGPQVRADRPFLFAIRERFSGAMLSLGAVIEPPPGI